MLVTKTVPIHEFYCSQFHNCKVMICGDLGKESRQAYARENYQKVPYFYIINKNCIYKLQSIQGTTMKTTMAPLMKFYVLDRLSIYVIRVFCPVFLLLVFLSGTFHRAKQSVFLGDEIHLQRDFPHIFILNLQIKSIAPI